MNPAMDGISHINIYSQGKTELGRMLSNFHQYPINTPDGKFMSVEGYWYWLSIEDCTEKEKLRESFGYQAKQLGKSILYTKNKRFEDEFETKIMKAIWNKTKQNLHLFEDKYKELPFEHYYNYSGKIYNVKKKYLWMMNGIDRMRNYIYKENLNANIEK